MKTKNLIQFAIVLVSIIALTFTSCMKDDLSTGNADPKSLEVLSADENTIEGIMNDAISDVGNLLSFSVTSFKSSDAWRPCNATIDSTAKVNDTITFYITYNGLTCNGKSMRTGKIEVSRKVGTRWEQAGATVLFKYNNLTVTRVGSGKSVTLNGTKTFVNVNGGLRSQVGTKITSYVETISGSMKASFDNSESRSWNVARKITYTGTQGQLILTVQGFGLAGNYQNLVVWGTNRAGEEFFTQITQSVIHREACDWDPVSGIKVHQIPSDSKSATVTFGYNANSQPVTGDECPTYYRVDWQKNNQSGTKYFPL